MKAVQFIWSALNLFALAKFSNADLLSELSSDLLRVIFIPDKFGNLVATTAYDILETLNKPDRNFKASRDVFFLLYTNNNPTSGQNISADESVIANSFFDTANPTRFVIHGYQNDNQSPVNVNTTAAYLMKGDFNIIVVDWGAGAMDINYVRSRSRVPEVANVVANLINFMASNGLIDLAETVIVGHSLGAQISGLTGKQINNPQVQAIFGLDPADPLFRSSNQSEFLTKTDAAYVEVIHTNGGLLGKIDPQGDADFYPNFGRSQPGCGFPPYGCSHSRAYTFFAESINSDGFVAKKCASFFGVSLGSRALADCDVTGFVMGGDPPRTKRSGLFYLTTNSEPPYAQG